MKTIKVSEIQHSLSNAPFDITDLFDVEHPKSQLKLNEIVDHESVTPFNLLLEVFKNTVKNNIKNKF